MADQDQLLAIGIKQRHFSGGSNVGGEREGDLSSVIRGITQDIARIKIETAGVGDFTDSSTGTVNAAISALVLPTLFDGESADAAPEAAFDTAAGVVENALAVLVDELNNMSVRLGTVQGALGDGTVATAGTIPAMTKTLAATNGATAIDFVTGRAAMSVLRNNFATVLRQANAILVALGESTLADLTGGSADVTHGQASLAATTAGTGTPAGSTSIDDTVMDTFLTALADNVAKIADAINTAVGIQAAALTDESTGSENGDVVAVITSPPPFTEAATASLTKVLADLTLIEMENDLSDLALRVNLLASRFGLVGVVDDTGASPNTTLEEITNDHSGAAAALVDEPTLNTSLALVRNNVSTLVARINVIVPFYGVAVLTDDGGGTPDLVAPHSIVNIPATGANNDGTSDQTVDVTPANAAFDEVADAVATIAAKLAEMTGTAQPTKPMKVVAAD